MEETAWKEHGLTLATMNQHVRKAEYAVRGKLVLRAVEMERAGKKVIFCNIGNPQALKQQPMTFLRSVISLCTASHLLKNPEDPHLRALFKADVVERARKYLSEIKEGTGAYSHSKGVLVVRKEVCDFIERRDQTGVAVDPENIFLSDGASSSIQRVLNLIISSPNVGVMLPIPQYPLYTATVDLLGGTVVPYYLEEDSGEWQLSVAELRRSLAEARSKGVDVRAIALINPGNPTGLCLLRGLIEDVLRFAKEERLVVLADEVYQENIYDPKDHPFVSFRKVAVEMGIDVQLFSFHSVSKGMLGECGRRGGYCEAHHVDPAVLEELYKLASVGLCSNLDGQLAVGIMVNPPKEGDASYEEFQKEYQDQYESLRRRAALVSARLNALPGMSCNPVRGSMYAFPRVHLTPKAVEAAAARREKPDFMYCSDLLNATGICVVPGSGFLQVDGTYHFRTTILPPEEDIEEVVNKLKVFQEEFMKKYA